jgi:YegS/Rv2252/BmrU family lipid kinase
MVSHLFIVNPQAHNGLIGKLWPKVEDEIKKRNFDYESILTEYPKHAIELARDKGKDFDCVVATGGDGTVNEVANGLYELDNKFGILPLGNGNDYAFGLKYDDNYHRSLDILEKGKTLDLGVGIAEADREKRYFVNIVDTGVGATISVSSFTEAKWLRGFAKYYYLAFKGIGKYRLVPTKIKIDDGDEIDFKLVIIALGFGSRFGGGFHMLPDNYQFYDDFAICYAGNIRKLRQYYLLNILKPGKHLGKKGVEYTRGKKVVLELGKPLPVEVEGEIVNYGATKIKFEVAPRRIKTVVPDEFLALKEEKMK